MPRDVWLRRSELGHEVTDSALAAGEDLQNREAGRIPQTSKKLRSQSEIRALRRIRNHLPQRRRRGPLSLPVGCSPWKAASCGDLG